MSKYYIPNLLFFISKNKELDDFSHLAIIYNKLKKKKKIPKVLDHIFSERSQIKYA